LSIGELRSRITIQSISDVSDGIGGKTRSWISFLTIWANIEPISAKERFFAQRIEHNVTHKITIRSNTLISAGMRVSYGSAIYQIKGIRDVKNRHRFSELLCEQGVGT
jgi:SPP1 family predicted phage head-tail adaptor